MTRWLLLSSLLLASLLPACGTADRQSSPPAPAPSPGPIVEKTPVKEPPKAVDSAVAKAGDAATRAADVRAALEAGQGPALSTVREIQSSAGRAAAVQALQESGIAKHADARLRARLVQVLGRSFDKDDAEGDRAVAQMLVELARDEETQVAVSAIGTLREASEKSRDVADVATPALAGLLKTAPPQACAAAMVALGDIGDAKAYRRADLSDEGNPLANADALLAIVACLDHKEKTVRAATVRTLAKLVEFNVPAAQRLLPEVGKRLGPGSPTTRAAAAESLRQMIERLVRTRKGLTAKLTPEGAKRVAAITGAIASIEGSLEKAATDADLAVRQEARDALNILDEAEDADDKP
jgi:hypothetical protein